MLVRTVRGRQREKSWVAHRARVFERGTAVCQRPIAAAGDADTAGTARLHLMLRSSCAPGSAPTFRAPAHPGNPKRGGRPRSMRLCITPSPPPAAECYIHSRGSSSCISHFTDGEEIVPGQGSTSTVDALAPHPLDPQPTPEFRGEDGHEESSAAGVHDLTPAHRTMYR